VRAFVRLHQGHLTQRIARERPQGTLALIGQKRLAIGRCLVRRHGLGVATGAVTERLVQRADPLAASSRPPPLVVRQVDGLALGDEDRQSPEVVTVGEPGVAAPPGTTEEAVEGAERRILLVSLGPRRAAEPRAGEPGDVLDASSQSWRAAPGSPCLSAAIHRLTEFLTGSTIVADSSVQLAMMEELQRAS
jgi:hypothetical protein